MTKRTWKPISTCPKTKGVVYRLKGKFPFLGRSTAQGTWDDFEGIWVLVRNGPDPDGEALSSYPDDKTAYGPTHWQS